MSDERDRTITELEALRDLDDASLLDHVQARHLIAYAEGRAEEDPVGVFVEGHLASCAVCRDAIEIYRRSTDVDAGPVEDGAPGAAPRDRDFLRRTLLAPVPALAYLILLVATLGLWWSRPAPPDAAGEAHPGTDLASTVRLFAEDTLRGDGIDPVPVVVTRTGGPVVLLAHTDLAPSDVDRPLTVRVERDGDPVFERTIEPADLADDGILAVLLPASALAPGTRYHVSVSGDLPFEASFVVEDGP